MKRDKGIYNLLNDYAEMEEEYKNVLKAMNLMKNFIQELGHFPEKGKQSEMDKKRLLLKELVWLREMGQFGSQKDFLEKHTSELELEVTSEIHEEDYEQLALPGFEAEQGKIRRAKKRISVSLFKERGCYRKTAAQRTQIKILADHSKKWLLDSHKYLITESSASRDGKDALADALAEWVTEYPLQLLLTLSRSDIRLLKKVSDAEEGEELSVTEKNIDSYTCLLVWGLLDVNIVYQKEEVFLGFSVPESVKEKILPKFENLTRDSMEHSDIWCYFASDGGKVPDLKSFWDRIEEVGNKIFLLVDYYGILDVDTFHQFFTEIFKINLTQKQLMRFTYLWGTFHNELYTGKNKLTQQLFVGDKDIDIQSVILKQQEYCQDIPCQSQTEDSLVMMLNHVMHLWSRIGEMFSRWEIGNEDVEDIIFHGRAVVREGASITELMDYFFDQLEITDQMDQMLLWRILVQIGLCTPLPMLKGYSRINFQEQYDKYLFLDLFRGTNKRVRKAALYELPVEIQEQLAKFVFMSEKADYASLKATEKTLPAACETNEQVRLLLVVNRLVSYRHIQDSRKKSEVAEEVREMVMSFCDECRDSETASALLKIAAECGLIHIKENNFWQEKQGDVYSFWDEEWEEPAEPVVKAEKIYPNDPCPCGSGKKFKKCCKGKGIYD